MRLLLVEDDEQLASILLRGLREEEFIVDHASDGEEALAYLDQAEYSVVVLDRLLPVLSGDEVLIQARRQGLQTPVLMLTALDSVEDRVTGLNGGADDYLCKPFAFDELLARIHALGRRAESRPLQSLSYHGLEVRPESHDAAFLGKPLPLRPTEYRLLELLVRRQERLVHREQILNFVWEQPWDVQDHSIDTLVKNLRRKLELSGAGQLLHTIRGSGYILEARDHEEME